MGANANMNEIAKQERLALGLPSRDDVITQQLENDKIAEQQKSEAVQKSEEMKAERKAQQQALLNAHKEDLGSMARYLKAISGLRKEYDDDVDSVRSVPNVIKYSKNDDGTDSFEWIPEDSVAEGDTTFPSTNALMSQLLSDYGIDQSDYTKFVGPMMDAVYGSTYPYGVAPPIVGTAMDAVAPRTTSRLYDDELRQRYGMAGPIALDVGENVALGALGYAGPKASARVVSKLAEGSRTGQKLMNSAPRLAPAVANSIIQGAGNMGIRGAGMIVDDYRGMGDNKEPNVKDLLAEGIVAGAMGGVQDYVFPSLETKARKALWTGLGEKRGTVNRRMINGTDVGEGYTGPWDMPNDMTKAAMDVMSGGEGSNDLQGLAQSAYKKYGFGDNTKVLTKPMKWEGITMDEAGVPHISNYEAFAKANDLDAGISAGDIEALDKIVQKSFKNPSSVEYKAVMSGQPRTMTSGQMHGYDRPVGYAEQMTALHNTSEPLADYVRRKTIPVGKHTGETTNWQLATDDYGKRWNIIKSNKNKLSNKSLPREYNILDTRRPELKFVAGGAKKALPVVRHDIAHAVPWNLGDYEDDLSTTR